MPMERKAPPAYPDGVYELAGDERGNVLVISNLTQNGITGFGSTRRTALFIFFGEYTIIIDIIRGIVYNSHAIILQNPRMYVRAS